MEVMVLQKILLTSSDRKCDNPNAFLGYEGENQANKLVFEFTDGFKDGLGVLNLKRGEEVGYVSLEKVGQTYEFPVRNAILSKTGLIKFQVVITGNDGSVIKYDPFEMFVKDAIDADSEMPEDYPSWVDMANAKLAEVDEAISDVETAIQNANGVADTLLQARQNGEFDGRDGEDGTDGVSPVVTTQQTSTGSTITITDAVGTHTATLSNGRDGTDGVDGISSEVSVKTNTETEYVLTITDKNGSFDTPNLKGKDSEGGIVNETDPIYLSEKSTLALKTEIPTKVSDLNNDSGYITSYTETDPTVPNHVKNITQANINSWNNKSDFSGSYDDLTNKPTIPSTEGLVTTQQLTQGLAAKQDVLTAGSNITIENGVISSTASGGGGLAELPVATASTLGGIKVGEGLEITEDGVLNALASLGKVTVLYNGDKLSTKGQTGTLNDDITNYDGIVCVASVSSLGNATTSFVPSPTLNRAYTLSFCWTSSVYYSVTYKFTDSKTIAINDKNVQATNWEPVGIDTVYGIKLGGGSNGGDTTPVGNIISFMGTIAPDGYLTCDGAVLNIADYSRLASHFETQFGTKNHFGGDGTTTFAIPDLRNEFLRGYHGEADEQLSGEIGVHQDATKHINTYGNAYGKGLAFGNASDDLTQAQNTDTTETFTHGYAQITGTKYTDVNPSAYYTSRPTNVAVLYCIKY